MLSSQKTDINAVELIKIEEGENGEADDAAKINRWVELREVVNNKKAVFCK